MRGGSHTGPCRPRGACREGPTGAWDGYTGGYTGWVIRVLVLPSHAARGGSQIPAKRAPESSLQGRVEWVGIWEPDVPGMSGGSGTALYHPAGPVSPLQGPPCTGPCRDPPWARFRSLFYKVSQNRKVSPKCVEKASRSP